MFRHLIALSVLAVVLAAPAGSALSLGGRGGPDPCLPGASEPSGDPTIQPWVSPCRVPPAEEGPTIQAGPGDRFGDRGRIPPPTHDAAAALPRVLVVPWLEPQPLPAPVKSLPDCRAGACSPLDAEPGEGPMCAMAYPWSRLCTLPGGAVRVAQRILG